MPMDEETSRATLYLLIYLWVASLLVVSGLVLQLITTRVGFLTWTAALAAPGVATWLLWMFSRELLRRVRDVVYKARAWIAERRNA